MSVLLTASRKACKAKSGKAKRKKQPSRARKAFDPTPPVSSPSTNVWHWELDGLPTTVMFNKKDQNLWIDGVVMTNAQLKPELSEDNEGVQIHFQIRDHKCCVKGILLRGTMTYQLFADGALILEHISSPHGYTPEVEGACVGPPAYYESPPSYDSVKKHK